MRRTLIAAVAMTALSAGAAIAQDEPLIRMGGVGLNVGDMAKAEKFYTEVIGMKVAIRVPASGPPKEIALSVSGSLTAGDAMVVLASLGDPLKPGRQGFGRVIMNTTDAAAVAARAKAAGFEAVSHGSAAQPVYFVTDPDGYHVELYQASAAQAKY